MAGEINAFQEYAMLTAKIKELEGRKDGLKIALTDAVKAADGGKIENDYGSFILKARPVYEFSAKVKKLEEAAKEAKQNEIDAGKAKVKSTTEYLEFRSK